MEASIKIENRSQLIYLLTEAAELEHGIMCCYLFTAFTLKNGVDEGVTEEQLRAIRRWRRLIKGIAVEEMLHLASVCNILTAVGGAPQLHRPNLPTSPRAYGAEFKLGLLPFTLETLEQFIAIEKPIEQVTGRRSLPSMAQPRLSDIFSSERAFDTQGKLYRGIEDGIIYLAQKYGPEGLFIGPPEAQTDTEHFELDGLVPVVDLPSAMEAIKIIVVQGEGASEETTDSHYAKFKSIYDEYRQILSEDPDFQPARPVLANPYSIMPTDMTDPDDINMIDDATTADLCNLFDGCYELLVQMLGRLFLHAEESEEEFVRLAHITEGLMVDIIDPLGTMLTALPAGPSYPGKNAGPGFRLSRAATVPAHRDSGWSVFHERMTELLNYCRFLQSQQGAPAALGKVRDAIARHAAALQTPAEAEA